MIEHWITKRVKIGERRVFFRNNCKENANVVVIFKNIIGLEKYVFKADLMPSSHYFYADMPETAWIGTKKFEYTIWVDNTIISEGSLRPSGKFENLI